MPSASLFSLIVPTRKRPECLRTFLASVAETVSQSSLIEVILVIDEDDAESKNISHNGLNLKKVIVPAGLSWDR